MTAKQTGRATTTEAQSRRTAGVQSRNARLEADAKPWGGFTNGAPAGKFGGAATRSRD